MATDRLSTSFAALADPTRRAILARLASGECSVTELAEPFEMSMPAVSKHLRVLERAGLISRSREAQWRPCRIEARPLKEVADWAENYRDIWERRLDRLETYLQDLQKKEKNMSVSHVANSGTFQVTTPSDREIRLTRLFDAPPQLVFEAMTKPEHVRRWWGVLSGRHSVAVCEIDLRVGGAWRFVGRGPEGNYPAFYGVYREIAAPGRLVYTEFFEPYPDGESVVTSLLTEEEGKTRLTVTSLYESLAVRDMVLKTGMEHGAAISYDRLEDVVRELRRS